MLLRATASVLLVSLALACSRSDSFECSASSQCMVDSIAGQCQPDGWCSFPDTECPSGQRYGELAGNRLAGECVPPGADTEDVGGSSIGSTDGATVTTAPDGTDDTSPEPDPDLGGIDPACGDGNVDATEECDDGDEVDENECTNACTLPRCGDGIVQAGEGCDDGTDNDDGSACTTSCTLASCGDGLVHEGVEQCDGTDLGGADCLSLGFPGGGEPTCTRKCVLDPSSCDACTMMGVQCNGFVPCDGMCQDGAECYASMMMAADTGTCLPSCMNDSDCADLAPTWPTQCVMGPVCVIDCQMTESCPTGMTCQDTPLGTICLW